MCGIVIEHHNGKVIGIKGDPADPLSRGHICPKAVALQDIYEDPDRLKQPLKKTSTGWETIGWSAAYQIIGKKIRQIQSQYGKNAIGIYSGNPTVHNYGTLLFVRDLTRALRTKNVFSATSVDQLPHHLAAQEMFGHWLLLPVADIDHTDYFLILGANPLASNGSLMTVPDVAKRFRAIQQRGGKIVVLDPRRTETCRKASEHYFIKPGTDALLLLSFIHILFRDQKIKLGHLADYVTSLDQVKHLVKPYTPKHTSTITGIGADIIEHIVQDFCQAKRAACYGRVGVSVQQFGGLCHWLIHLINILTENFDTRGGAMFPTPAVSLVKDKGTYHKYNRWQSSVRGLPEFNGELPVAVLAEEILQAKNPIKGLIVSAGNPVLSTPNGTQLDKAFEKLAFMVSIDIYLNETSRHADIILPPATGLETDHYDIIFYNLAIRNTAKYSPALFKPKSGTQYDWQIYKALTNRIRDKKPWLDWKSPTRLLNLGLMTGPYGRIHYKNFFRKGLSLKHLKDKPHGIDLGPLKPCMPQRLKTKDKKIHLAPDIFVRDLTRLDKKYINQSKTTSNTFSLISRRHLRSNNSWMHNSLRLIKGKNRCTLMMHPIDAKRLGFSINQSVQVRSRVAAVSLPLEISDEMLPGVISMPHGYGHSRAGIKMSIAQDYPGVSINDLTDDLLIDELTGTAAFSDLVVQVTAEQ